MTEKISFIHAADLHLDSPFKGLAQVPKEIFQEIRTSTFEALNNLVKVAIDKQVDFVLLTGDLFDNENQSLKAQVKLRQAFEQLNEHHIQVYVSYGNHDYIKGNKYPIDYPQNVHIFPDETVRSFNFTKNEKLVAKIYGFSYEKRAVLENKAKQYEIEDEQIPFHIAMLHGSVSSNTEHDRYAPFQISDLISSPFNYWALGHIHKREVLHANPPIIYPGNIQGRNRKELGEKGCYYVEMSKTESKQTFIPLQVVEYKQLTVNTSACDDIYQVESLLKKELEKQRNNTPQLIDLLFTSVKENIIDWKVTKQLEDMVEILNESYMNQANWLFIFRFQANYDASKDSIVNKNEFFVGEIWNQLENATITDYVHELYFHKDARKFMNPLTDEELLEIKKEAQELLVHQFSEKGTVRR